MIIMVMMLCWPAQFRFRWRPSSSAAVPRVLAECYSGISTQSKYLTVDSIYVLPRGLNSSMYPCHVCMHDVRPCEAAAATMQDMHIYIGNPILEDKVTNIRCPLAETK